MTINKISSKEWERVVPVGEHNETYFIEATEEGLLIGYNTIPWKELDDARCALSAEVRKEHPETGDILLTPAQELEDCIAEGMKLSDELLKCMPGKMEGIIELKSEFIRAQRKLKKITEEKK